MSNMEPRITYEVHARRIGGHSTDTEGPQGGAYGLKSLRVANLEAESFTREEAEIARAERREVTVEFVVVQATETLQVIEPDTVANYEALLEFVREAAGDGWVNTRATARDVLQQIGERP